MYVLGKTLAYVLGYASRVHLSDSALPVHRSIHYHLTNAPSNPFLFPSLHFLQASIQLCSEARLEKTTWE